MPLTSVAGGSWNDGNWFASAGFCGPGSSRLVRLLPLTLPSGGESGLPNEAADAAADTPRAAAEAAAPSRISRRDKLVMGCLTDLYLGESQSCGPTFLRSFGGLAGNYDCNIPLRLLGLEVRWEVQKGFQPVRRTSGPRLTNPCL